MARLHAVGSPSVMTKRQRDHGFEHATMTMGARRACMPEAGVQDAVPVGRQGESCF